MTRRSLAAAASLLYGQRWQRPLSRSLNVNDRLVRRWASGERPIPSWVEPTLASLLQQRIESIHDEILRATKDLDVTDLDAKCKTSPDRKFPS